MQIWVDADACPGPVRDIIFKAARRRGVAAVFVANKQLMLPISPNVSFVLVGTAPDEADSYIRDHAVNGDLAVTQDIPLAHTLVHAGIVVISPRGESFTRDNISDRLSLRDLMQDLRDSGAVTGGPGQFGAREKRAFAAVFDREVTRLLSSSPEQSG